jgi:predicted O-methyltransferase YrrM
MASSNNSFYPAVLMFLLVAPFYLTFSSVPSPPNKVFFTRHFNRALLYHQTPELLPNAIVIYRKLLLRRPDSLEVLSNLASAIKTVKPHSPEVVQLYLTAVQYYPKHARVRMNYGTSLADISNDPNGALDQLEIAKELAHPNDVLGISNILQNAASIASINQLWPRNKIEKYFLAAKIINPGNKGAQQNLLLFQHQEMEAAKRTQHLVKQDKNAVKNTVACCSNNLMKHLCQAMMELEQNHKIKELYQKNESKSCLGDDFCDISSIDIQAAVKVACEPGKEIGGIKADTNNNNNKKPATNSLIKHIRSLQNCHECSRTREGKILQNVMNVKKLTFEKESVNRILKEIDSFTGWHMSMGKEKCNILRQAISDHNKHIKHTTGIHLEFGGYIGYSALCVSTLPIVKSIISIERNPIFAAFARTIIEKAGMSNKIKIHVGEFISFVETMTSAIEVTPSNNPKEIQLSSVFFDHWKDNYLPSLKEMENNSTMLSNNVIIIADNIIHPGVPKEYLNYVRDSAPYLVSRTRGGEKEVVYDDFVEHVEWKSKTLYTAGPEHLEEFKKWIHDGLEISTRKTNLKNRINHVKREKVNL